jgi:hypothetical protein
MRFDAAVFHAKQIFYLRPKAETGGGFKILNLHGEARVSATGTANAEKGEIGGAVRGEIGLGIKGTKYDVSGFAEVSVKSTPNGVEVEGDRGLGGSRGLVSSDTTGDVGLDVGLGTLGPFTVGFETGANVNEGNMMLGELGLGILDLAGLGNATATNDPETKAEGPCEVAAQGPCEH